MFLKTSRYAQLPQAQVDLSDGRKATLVRLRRLPPTDGTDTVVKGNDQLDVMAERRYGDATRFWHIADANTELQANDLVAALGRTIRVPED